MTITPLIGTSGDDRLVGAADQNISGGDGNDTIIGGSGHNIVLTGGAGNDVIVAGSDGDIIRDKIGNNNIIGGAGNDNISLGDGNDTVRAGAGNDFIEGGGGNDNLGGGAGSDTFYYDFSNGKQTGGDKIGDFVAGEDKIVLHDFNGQDITLHSVADFQSFIHDLLNDSSATTLARAVGKDLAINLDGHSSIMLVGHADWLTGVS
ncbi:calcium-binding protein [Bradyrhizobium sp. USDA 10063]